MQEARGNKRTSQERIDALEHRLSNVRIIVRLLENILQDKPLDCLSRQKWPSQCEELLQQWAEQLEVEGDEANLRGDTICLAAELLLTGSVWLERLDVEEVAPQWLNVLELAEEVQERRDIHEDSPSAKLQVLKSKCAGFRVANLYKL